MNYRLTFTSGETLTIKDAPNVDLWPTTGYVIAKTIVGDTTYVSVKHVETITECHE